MLARFLLKLAAWQEMAWSMREEALLLNDVDLFALIFSME